MEDLGNEIRKWILKKSIAQSNDIAAFPVGRDCSETAAAADSKKAKSGIDDLYDF